MRDILHCDMNNFYASVECLLSPNIAMYPLAVSGNPKKRTGIILAKNYIAKDYGVQTGESIYTAKTKCPKLICVPPHYEKYYEYSKRAKAIYYKYTNLVESFGIDEAWLDVTDSKLLFGSPVEIAKKIQDEIFDTLGLSISIGVSYTKTLAKLGSDIKKPKGLTVIYPENMKQVIGELKTNEILFVGKQTEKILKRLNIFKLSDLMNCNVDILRSKLGVNGTHLYNIVNGIGDDDVMPNRHADSKSIGNGKTSPIDLKTKEEIIDYIYMLSDSVSMRMREENVDARTVTLSLKMNDFSNLSAQKKCEISISSCESIVKVAIKILDELIPNNIITPIRAVRIKCSNLDKTNSDNQISLFDNKNSKDALLGPALDNIRKKFGDSSISFLKKKD